MLFCLLLPLLDANTAIDKIVQLSPAERLSLIAQLWDSLEQQRQPLSLAQEAELNRRLDSLEEDRSGFSHCGSCLSLHRSAEQTTLALGALLPRSTRRT